MKRVQTLMHYLLLLHSSISRKRAKKHRWKGGANSFNTIGFKQIQVFHDPEKSDLKAFLMQQNLVTFVAFPRSPGELAIWELSGEWEPVKIREG